MFLAAQTSYNNCNFSSHSPQHKRLFHGNAYEKAAKAYQIEKCNSFHWSHFREKGVGIWLSWGGVRGAVDGCLVSVCAAALCVSSTSVYEAFKSLQMCCGLRPIRVLPKPPWASCQRGATVKINSTDTVEWELWGLLQGRVRCWLYSLACKITLNNFFHHFIFILLIKRLWAV